MYNYLGENSEYVLDIIKALEFSKIPENLHHSNSAATSLIYEIQGWLSEISPGVNFTFEIDNKSDLGNLNLIHIDQTMLDSVLVMHYR